MSMELKNVTLRIVESKSEKGFVYKNVVIVTSTGETVQIIPKFSGFADKIENLILKEQILSYKH